MSIRAAVLPALAELALLSLALAALATLAAPLGDPVVMLGRGARYAATAPGTLVSGKFASLPAQAFAQHIGALLSLLALSGWLVLVLGRLALPAGAILMFACAIWSALLAWLFLQPPGPTWPLAQPQLGQLASVLAGWPWWALPAAAMAAVPLASRLTCHSWQAVRRPSRVWLYPMWVLLTGLGLLWLTDYSARAAVQHRHLAQQQFQALALAYAVLTILAGTAPSALNLLARALARADGATLNQKPGPGIAASRFDHVKRLHRAVWPRVGLLVVLALWAALVLLVVGLHPAQSALRAEAIRLPLVIGGGWLAYRWIDDSQGLRWSFARGMLAASALIGVALLPLAGTGDNGQVLLLTLAAAALLGGITGGLVRKSLPAAGLGLLVFAALVAAVMWALFTHGAAHSRTVAFRLEALAKPWASHYEYLSELRWFMANTPAGGHGLGHVPWCGTLASLVDGACTAIPRQTQSDYVLAALVGVWGDLAALAIAAATAVWLLGLMPSACETAGPGLAPRADRLGAWIVTFFACISLVQLFVTCLGSLGLMPLTGVGFPLLAYGKASLLVTACIAAFGINRPAHPQP